MFQTSAAEAEHTHPHTETWSGMFSPATRQPQCVWWWLVLDHLRGAAIWYQPTGPQALHTYCATSHHTPRSRVVTAGPQECNSSRETAEIKVFRNAMVGTILLWMARKKEIGLLLKPSLGYIYIYTV